VLIYATVLKLQQCKYAGGYFIPPPSVAWVRRPNSVAGLKVDKLLNFLTTHKYIPIMTNIGSGISIAQEYHLQRRMRWPTMPWTHGTAAANRLLRQWFWDRIARLSVSAHFADVMRSLYGKLDDQHSTDMLGLLNRKIFVLFCYEQRLATAALTNKTHRSLFIINTYGIQHILPIASMVIFVLSSFYIVLLTNSLEWVSEWVEFNAPPDTIYVISTCLI